MQNRRFLAPDEPHYPPTYLDLYRLPPVELWPDGGLDHFVDLTAPPFGAGSGALMGGASWNFQFWYRDPQGGGAGSNFTDALRITFCD